MKLVAVIAASLLSTAAFAQDAAVETETVSPGLLGKRHVSAGFSWTDVNHSGIDAMGAGLDLNLPFNRNFDFSLGYGYAWLEGARGLGHSVGASVTGYLTRGENKPFARLSSGYSWDNSDWSDDDFGTWGAEVGIERAVNAKISSSFSVGYNDAYEGGVEGAWYAAVGGTYNFTSRFVGTAEIAYLEGGSFGYSAGLAFRF